MKERTNTLFFNASNGTTNVGSILIVAGFPLLLCGQFWLGILTILLGLVIGSSHYISEADKVKIRFNASSPEDILADLLQISHTEISNKDVNGRTSRKTPLDDEDTRIKYIVEGISALGRKYGKSKDRQKISLGYQQVAFATMRSYPQNDEIIAGSISLLALIAKDPEVRKRFINQKQEYSLTWPIDVLKKVLERARNEKDETKEELLAEILRKGCLFLGALSNDGEDLGLSSLIVTEGGLELILETANWFRLHEDVSNWALWAVFTLCYDCLPIKARLVQLNGIQTICGLMENNPTSLEVNRHGTALLFDLLRENQNTDGVVWDPWEIRKAALASGLHNRVLSAMNKFSDSMDIMMMGQEMLIGTGYRGDIPKYQQM